MQHVDEGTLHAYLDGALPLPGQPAPAEVERHLDACADCRRALEEARSIRDGASAVLGAADLAIDDPGFEAVRRRQAARTHRRLVRLRVLAAAAIVVAAVGVSSVLRNGADREIDGALGVAAAARSEADSAVPATAPMQLADAEIDAAGAEGGGAALPARTDVTTGAADVAAAAPPAAPTDAPEPAQPRRADDLADAPVVAFAEQRAEPAAAAKAEPDLRSAVAGVAAATEPVEEVARRGRGAPTTSWQPADRVQAAAHLGWPPPTLDGFEATAYAIGGIGTVPAVRVDYRADDGRTVRLVTWPVADGAPADELNDPATVVVTDQAVGVAVSGDLPRSELERLAAQALERSP